jgi:methylmalonyl-CoA mutase cobalamin-binding domain/chain
MNTRNWADQLLKAMIATDRAEAAVLIERVIQEGMAPERVISDVLGPTLVRVGVLWGKESVSLAQTFVAAKIAEDVLLRCMPEMGAGESHKSPVVIGNIEDDFHSLGRRIVATFLRAAGWEVYDLGNDVTAEEFVDKAVEVQASVVGVSAMMQTTALNIRKVRALIDARGLQDRLKLVVGGAVFNWRPQLVAEVGGDGTAENAAGADALLRRLQSEAKGEPSHERL